MKALLDGALMVYWLAGALFLSLALLFAPAHGQAAVNGFVPVGDSISVQIPDWVTYHEQLSTPGWQRIINASVAGGYTTTALEEAALNVDARYSRRYTTNAVFLWVGTNDLALGLATPQQVFDNLKRFGEARRLAGYRVLVFTILPRSGGPPGWEAAFNAARAEANTLIRAGYTSFADGVVDVAADPIIGPDGASSNPTYYGDLVHLTTAGHARVATLVDSALGTLPSGSPAPSLLDASLAAYWPMNGSLSDVHNGLHLTGSPTWMSGPRGGQALAGQAYRADESLLDGGQSFTISLSVALLSKNESLFTLGKWQTGSQEYALFYYQPTDRWLWMLGDGGVGTIGGVYADAYGSPPILGPVPHGWQHVMAWYDGPAGQLGVRVTDTEGRTGENVGTVSGVPSPGTALIIVGDDGGAQWLREVLFTRRLTTRGESDYLRRWVTTPELIYPFAPVG